MPQQATAPTPSRTIVSQKKARRMRNKPVLHGTNSSKTSRARKSRAYFQTSAYVPEPAALYIEGLLAGHNPHSKALFKHVLVSGLSRSSSDGGYVPVPSKLIERCSRGADVRALEREGLLEVSGYSRVERRCREFRVPLLISEEYLELLMQHLTAPQVDLFSLQPARGPKRSVYSDESGHAYPELLREAMGVIEPNGLWNLEEAHRFLKQQKAALERLKERAEACLGSPQYLQALHEYERALRRFAHDVAGMNAILANRTGELRDGVIQYRVPYVPTLTGRLSFIGGGAQSCTREMKAAGYSGIPNIHNYDLVSSQAVILVDLLAEAGLPTNWLEEYLVTPKECYAALAGLSVDVWKTCLYAAFMGAELPEPSWLHLSRGEVRRVLLEAVGEEGLLAAYSRFYEVVKPFYEKSLKPWHRHLSGGWLEENARVGRGGKKYVRNAVGMTLCVSEYRSSELPRKLAAFLLQGKEAHFIHTLTVLSHRYGFIVVANEHDGLVTLGEIPEEAVEEARKRTGMGYARLQEKNFVGKRS